MSTVVVDTGVFSASLSRKRKSIAATYEKHIAGREIVVAYQTVSEMRFGALVAGWGESRLAELERRIAFAQIAVIDDAIIWTHARLRFACCEAGHALAKAAHATDLWIATVAVHLDIPLVTYDNVFRGAPRLELVSEA